jgi:outer membrane protein assembly factor BamA
MMNRLFLFLIALIPWLCAAQDTSFHQHEPWHVRNIHIIGPKKTKEKIILREINLKEGITISGDTLSQYLQQDWDRLFNMGLFTEINIATDTLLPDTVDVRISLKERWFIIPEFTFQLADRNFNVWLNEQKADLRRTIIGVTLRHKNLTGNMDNMSVTLQAGYTQKLYLDYTFPYIDKQQKHGVGISFGYAESGEMFYQTDSNKLKFIKTHNRYITNQWEGSVAYLYRPDYAYRHIIRLRYKWQNVDDTVLVLNPDFYQNSSHVMDYLELSYRLEANLVDNWQYPLKGIKLVGQAFYRKGFHGFNHQLGATIEAGKFNHLKGKWYSSVIFRGRLVTPETQPYALREAMGTRYEYVRGYEYYVVDGYQFGILRTNLKYELFRFNFRNIPFRYLPVIPLRVYPKIFADFGYVNNPTPGNSFLNNKALYSAGIGLDIFTAYDIKIRLEYAWNHMGQKGLFLHLHSE